MNLAGAFRQILDHFNIEAKRHRNIMASLEDVKAGQAEIMAAIEALVKEGREALSSLKDTGAAGHSAVLDEVANGDKKILDAVTNARGELKAAIATTPMPGTAPGPM